MAYGNICCVLTRLCARSSWTNKLIPAKDHGSIQVNIGHLDEEGVYKTGQYTTFALHGTVRATVRSSSTQEIYTCAAAARSAEADQFALGLGLRSKIMVCCVQQSGRILCIWLLHIWHWIIIQMRLMGPQSRGLLADHVVLAYNRVRRTRHWITSGRRRRLSSTSNCGSKAVCWVMVIPEGGRLFRLTVSL